MIFRDIRQDLKKNCNFNALYLSYKNVKTVDSSAVGCKTVQLWLMTAGRQNGSRKCCGLRPLDNPIKTDDQKR